MKFGTVGLPGLVIQLSQNSVFQLIQLNKVGILRCLVKANILSTILLLLTNCDSFYCDKITEEVGWIARVGQTTKENVWEGWTTRVGQLSTNHVVWAVEMSEFSLL